MRWFRDHIRRGSWLALVALITNLSLSFGHVHVIDGTVLDHTFASHVADIAAPDDGQPYGTHDGDRVDLLCPICIVASAIDHALSSAPPALSLDVAWSSIDQTNEPVFVVPQRLRSAFHSRRRP